MKSAEFIETAADVAKIDPAYNAFRGCLWLVDKAKVPLGLLIFGGSCFVCGIAADQKGREILIGLLPNGRNNNLEPTPISTPALPGSRGPEITLTPTPTRTPNIVTATPSPTLTAAATTMAAEIGAADVKPSGQETQPTLIPNEDDYVVFVRDILTAAEKLGIPVAELDVTDPQSGTSGPLGKNLPTLLAEINKESKLPNEAKVTIGTIVSTLAQMTGNPATDEPLKNQIWQLLVGLSKSCGVQCTDLINDLSNYLLPGAGQEKPLADNQSASVPENIPSPADIPSAPTMPLPTPPPPTPPPPLATATPTPTAISDIFATAKAAEREVDAQRKAATATATARLADATAQALGRQAEKEVERLQNKAKTATAEAAYRAAAAGEATQTAVAEKTTATPTPTRIKEEEIPTPYFPLKMKGDSDGASGGGSRQFGG